MNGPVWVIDTNSGELSQWPADVGLPANKLRCNGTLYDGTNPLYNKLWNIVGTRYGGSGVTSFAVPDLGGINKVRGATTAQGDAGTRYSILGFVYDDTISRWIGPETTLYSHTNYGVSPTGAVNTGLDDIAVSDFDSFYNLGYRPQVRLVMGCQVSTGTATFKFDLYSGNDGQSIFQNTITAATVTLITATGNSMLFYDSGWVTPTLVAAPVVANKAMIDYLVTSSIAMTISINAAHFSYRWVSV